MQRTCRCKEKVCLDACLQGHTFQTQKDSRGFVVHVSFFVYCSYFLYTPLLPACATGTVEERSIVEPVRKVLGSKVALFDPLSVRL